MDVSLIIPTFRRTQLLKRTLESLLRLETSPEVFEVIVVDNAGEEALRERISDLSDERVPIRYVAEPEPGIHNARHRGAREAVSALLLYVDDDAVCEPNWITAYGSAFKTHPDMQAASGPVVPLWDREPEAWLRELARVVTEGGVCILTIEGRTALRKMENLLAGEAHNLRVQMEKAGVLYREYPDLAVEKAEGRRIAFGAKYDGVNGSYGSTAMLPSYVYKAWAGHGFEVVDIVEGIIDNRQDMVVLRRG